MNETDQQLMYFALEALDRAQRINEFEANNPSMFRGSLAKIRDKLEVKAEYLLDAMEAGPNAS